MYNSVMFVGINNCSTVQPMVAIERIVFYRERSARMYSALPYAMAQVCKRCVCLHDQLDNSTIKLLKDIIIHSCVYTCIWKEHSTLFFDHLKLMQVVVKIPYVLLQTICYTLIVYSMVGFECTATKFLWFFFVNFFTFLYFICYGMLTVSMTLNHQLAAIRSSAFFSLFNLFSGFYIPKPKILKRCIWYYYICPVAWTVYGLIVSQFGDVEHTIKVPGMAPDPTIKWYMQEHFGYDPDSMGQVVVVLVGFTVFFTFMYADCLKKLNFQTR